MNISELFRHGSRLATAHIVTGANCICSIDSARANTAKFQPRGRLVTSSTSSSAKPPQIARPSRVLPPELQLPPQDSSKRECRHLKRAAMAASEWYTKTSSPGSDIPTHSRRRPILRSSWISPTLDSQAASTPHPALPRASRASSR